VTSHQDDRLIRRLAVRDPTISANDILAQLPPSVSPSVTTVKRRLQLQYKLQAYHPATKPMRSAKNVKDRITFCNHYKHWMATDWHKVMFSDETMMRQFYSLHSFVRRPANQRYNSRYCIPTVKFSASVMMWGSISVNGTAGMWFAPRGTTVNAAVYLKILQDNLPLIMPQHNCTVFQHDGAPCHTARLVKNWMTEQNIRVLDKWPGSSSDLNPIEHAWSALKKKVMLMRPTSLVDLVEKIKTVWRQQITPDYCRDLIESMPSRISAVLKARGGNSKY
jgi:hypothetical protein